MLRKNKDRKNIKKRIAAAIAAAAICVGAAFIFCRPQIYAIVGKIGGDRQLCSAGGGSVTTRTALHLRNDSGLFADIICTLPKGTTVTVLDNSNSEWTKIKTDDGQVGWCSSQYLGSSSASSESSASSSAVSEKSVQAGAEPKVQQVSLEDSTKPLHIDVSLSNQKVEVLDAKDRDVKTFACSSGKKGSETPTGMFTVSQRGRSFFNDSLNEGAYYWVRFYKAYLFHSVPFDKNGQIEQSEADKLGEPASHGCLRMSVENAKWIYDNIPDGTEVSIK